MTTQTADGRPRNVAILLFAGVEVLDFAGPFEVFSVAARLTDPPSFRVYTIAETVSPVVARDDLAVLPRYALSDCPPPDVLVVPGGQGTRREMHNTALTGWIRLRAAEAERVLSVCTGALLLAKAGLLDGLKATTHHGSYDLLREAAPAAKVLRGPRFVDNGKVTTSAGIVAGVDAALHVVAVLLGKTAAERTARHMEYPWAGA